MSGERADHEISPPRSIYRFGKISLSVAVTLRPSCWYHITRRIFRCISSNKISRSLRIKLSYFMLLSVPMIKST